MTTLSREAAFRSELSAWRPSERAQERLRVYYLGFLDRHREASLDRSAGPAHLTASCFVFSADLQRVLLCFHKKGQFWVQLGGHIEKGDPSVAAAAFREAVEEGGIPDLVPLSHSLLDLDRHELGGGFSRCDVHWDVGFAAIASETATPAVSDESEDVRWWPVAALPEKVPDGFGQRLDRIVRGAAAGLSA